METERKRHSLKNREFVNKYWSGLVVVGTVVGATVWLISRFIKNKKEKGTPEYAALTQLETEALTDGDDTSILLETGTQLVKIAGAEVKAAADELKEHLPDEKAKETLRVLKHLAPSNS